MTTPSQPRWPNPGSDGRLKEKHLPAHLGQSNLNATYAPVLGATGYAPRDLASFVTDGDSRTQLNGNVSTDAASASGT
uniref:hypothetical protein n=1 Tax=Rhodococcus ruber TaxID=1830 RepID=UPI0037839F22